MGHPAEPRRRASPSLSWPVPAKEDHPCACLEELTDAECCNLLAERHLGRLALVDAQGPVTGRRSVIPADLPFTWCG
jgi:hypothetical protein